MKLYFTGASSEGGAQTSPNKSLGGKVSGSELPNGSLNNLFGAISQYGLEKKIQETRAIVLKNTTSTTVTAPSFFYNIESSDPITNYRFAFVSLAQDDCGWFMDSIANGQSSPIGVTWINPLTSVNQVTLPDLASNQYLGVWVERTFNKVAADLSQSCSKLSANSELEDVNQIDTIQFPSDTSNSLDGKSFKLRSGPDSYIIYTDTGAGATPPTSTSDDIIRVPISTDDSAENVAAAVLSQLNLIVDSRGYITSTINLDTITVTNNVPGASIAPSDIDMGVTSNTTTVGVSGSVEVEENIQVTFSW